MLYPPLSHDEFVAWLLVDIWTLGTGRTLRRDVPPDELTTEELIDFWSDEYEDDVLSAKIAERFEILGG